MSTVRIITERARKVQRRVWDELVMLVRDACILLFGMFLGALLMAAAVMR